MNDTQEPAQGENKNLAFLYRFKMLVNDLKQNLTEDQMRKLAIGTFNPIPVKKEKLNDSEQLFLERFQEISNDYAELNEPVKRDLIRDVFIDA